MSEEPDNFLKLSVEVDFYGLNLSKENAMDRHPESGQGLLEYALIISLVLIIVIIVLAILGPAIGNLFSNVVSNI